MHGSHPKKSAQSAAPNSNLRTALERLAKSQGAPQADLAASLKKLAEAQSAAPNSNLTAYLAHLNASMHGSSPGSVPAARWAGIRNGFRHGAIPNLNPWLNALDPTPSSAAGALKRDWRRVEADLWTTIGRLRTQLNEIPMSERSRLTDALVEYLRSSESR
ncbi:MAG TPA: hypothetical protein VF729_03430 [Solirubrobacterales bacterium]